MDMRKLLIALLVMLGIYFILSRFTEVHQIIETLQKGDLRWLALAAVAHLAYSFNIGASFQAIYRLLGLKERVTRLTALAIAANFVVVVAPSAGMGGIALFAADAKTRGHSTGRVTTAAMLFTLYDYVATLIIVLLGLIILFQHNQLNAGEISAALILLLLAIGLGSLLYLGMKSGKKLGQVLAWLGGWVNRILRPFLRRDYLDLSRAHKFGKDAAEGLRQARKAQEGLLLPFALALSTKAFMVTILFLMFLAFQQPFSIGTLIAGFSVGYLFTIVSPTPAGIGFVETAMTLGLNSMRVPLAPAALIVLGYRGFTLWLSILYGMIAIRWVGKPAEEEAALEKQPSSAGAAANPHDQSADQASPQRYTSTPKKRP
jgi:uncharacterized protein (TIRG00374 family)